MCARDKDVMVVCAGRRSLKGLLRFFFFVLKLLLCRYSVGVAVVNSSQRG